MGGVLWTLAAGTVFFAAYEQWRMLDAFWYSFVTLTTIGSVRGWTDEDVLYFSEFGDHTGNY